MDALLALLSPGWRLVLGVCVVVAVVAMGFRLALRGPSPITRAMVAVALALLALVLLTLLLG